MNKLNIKAEQKIDSVEDFKFEPIKGYPMLHWRGKRPFTATQFYPAQLKETFGEDTDNWLNKIFWGDNLQVMSHLLKKYRGQVDLIYIDPPFDSKADYKKKIELRGSKAENDNSAFEEKQYTDIWSNDEYLQFMYERLVLLRELLTDEGCILVHCDYHKGQYIRCLLDEIFGPANFVNDIVWQRTGAHNDALRFGIVHDYIFAYSKATKYRFNPIFVELTNEHIVSRFNLIEDGSERRFFAGPITAPGDGPARNFHGKSISPPNGRHWSYSQDKIDILQEENRIYYSKTGTPYLKQYMDEYIEQGRRVQSIWSDLLPSKTGTELLGYPTQKPEKLLSRIVSAYSKVGDLVFDCFMGSGTTQAVAMKLGRRFIGADINLGAIDTTTKRLLKVQAELLKEQQKLNLDAEKTQYYTGFEVYNVNNYDVFRNPVEARDILSKALELQPLPGNDLYDGEKDGRFVKIMPINRIATRADLNELITNFPYAIFDKRNDETPGKPVELITLVCMGHEPDLAGYLILEMRKQGYAIDVEVVDILRDKSNLEFKRDSEADIFIEGDKLVIRDFYPMNLLNKLSLQKESVDDWRELTDSVKIDFNFDDSVFTPSLVDIPAKNEVVKGAYQIPSDASKIKVKITDLLSESIEVILEIK